MANFNTHLTIAAATGTGTALILVNIHLIAVTDMPWLVFLGIVGGMLPDIDANNSRPVKLLFNVLALMGMATALQVFKSEYSSYRLLSIAAAAYLLIRYGVFALFNNLTVHRGVFHSLLAAAFFALLITCISYYFVHWDVLQAWLNGLFIAVGLIVHLFLDEFYSVNLSNSRLKKSFGTALKLFSYNNMIASVLMTICTLALYWITPSPIPLVSVWEAADWNDYLTPARFLQQ